MTEAETRLVRRYQEELGIDLRSKFSCGYENQRTNPSRYIAPGF